MTEKEEMVLRELAAGRCTIQRVVDAVGPLSLWSKEGLDRVIRKAVEVEREACAKVCEDDCGNGTLNLAEAIRARGQV